MQDLQNKNEFTSLELVEQINIFRKQEGKSELLHKNFMQVIRNEFEEEIDELKIKPVKYKDQKGEERPMFILTSNQAKQVLVRESRTIRKAVIAYIEKLENKNQSTTKALPSNYKQALLELVEQIEINEKLELENKFKDQQISEMKPKINYVDKVLSSQSLINITQIAKDYGMSAIKFNDLLHQLKIQYKLSGQWLLYQEYAKQGYTQSETVVYVDNYGIERTKLNTKWTQKGRLFIYETLKEHGYLPNIEK